MTGQSFVPESVADTDLRVGSGVGFGTESSAWTLAHELGHLNGRSDAPCGTTGLDRTYPYAGGSIGVFGYDARTDTLLDPSPSADLMGYCDPTWISDYTYAAIWRRVIEQRGGRVIRSAAPLAISMLERAEGALRWRRDATLSALPSGSAVQVRAEDASVRALAEASGVEVQLSHGASRLVFPAWTAEVRARAAWIVVTQDGVATRVAAPRP